MRKGSWLLVVGCWLLVVGVPLIKGGTPQSGGGDVSPVDSINKKYVAKQQYLKQQYDARVDELIKTDPVLNQIRGASRQLEIERQEALKLLSESPDSILQKIKEGLKNNP